jgi:hypothetical protein
VGGAAGGGAGGAAASASLHSALVARMRGIRVDGATPAGAGGARAAEVYVPSVVHLDNSPALTRGLIEFRDWVRRANVAMDGLAAASQPDHSAPA